MQAMTIKRFSVHKVALAAVAVGVLAIGITGAVAINEVTSGDATEPAAVTRGIQQTGPAQTMRFMEENVTLPPVAATDAARVTFEQLVLVEHNTLLPGYAATTPASSASIWFLEQNSYLPGGGAAVSSESIVFNEDNLWLPGGESLLPNSDATGGDPSY